MKKIVALFIVLVCLAQLGTARTNNSYQNHKKKSHTIFKQWLPQFHKTHKFTLPVIVYGPKEFERSKGTPKTEVDTFSLKGNSAAPYTMVVTNAFCDDKEVTSAIIKLNGVQIFGPSDFKKNKPLLIKTVNLPQSNTITVKISGKRGTHLLITILGKRSQQTDTTPPTLALTSPTDGLITRDSSILVSGTAADASAVSVTINGEAAVVGAGGEFSEELALVEGVNAISVVATDASNNTSTATRTVIKDTTPPQLTINNDELTITKQPSVIISGTVMDSTDVTVIVNGNSTPVLDGALSAAAMVSINGISVPVVNGAFSAEVPLVEGLNVITIQAIDAAGNFSTATRTVRKDALPPVVVVSGTTEGMITNQSSVQINGSANDSTAVTVTVNGNSVPVEGGTFTYTAALNEGLNTITIVITDGAGNSTTITRVVRRDTVPPQLTINSPLDGAVVSGQTSEVSGTVSDSTAVIVTVNGNIIPVISGAFSYEATLSEGTNTIAIIATDTVGNSSTVTRMVKRDSTPPTITLSSPINNFVTNQSTIQLTGTVTDSSTTAVAINGNYITILEDGSFSETVTLLEGTNTIIITATDALENISAQTITIIKDSILPLLTVSSPQEGTVVNSQTSEVGGTVSDSTLVTLTINGDTVDVVDGVFSGNVTLSEGTNIITITSIDAAGNTASITRTVILDMIAPVLTVTLPPDNSVTNQTPIEISGTIVDSTTVTVTVNGNGVPVSNGGFSMLYTLAEGLNVFNTTATDIVGNSTLDVRRVRLDTQPPVIIITAPVDGESTSQNIIDVSGSIQDSTSVTLLVNGLSVPIAVDGSFSTSVSLVEGSNSVTFAAADAAGNQAAAARTVTRVSGEIPPDPATVAPPIDETVPTTLADASSFLYTGRDSIQKEVKPGAIEVRRVAVIRGKVLTRDLTPLPGVKVTVLDHPEFGYTISRFDGMFDMAVNGDASVIIDYRKDNYLPVQRQVAVPYQQYTIVDSVVMIQLDPQVTVIDFSDPIEVARGSIVSDERGTRRATLFFRQGTVARMIKKRYEAQPFLNGCTPIFQKVLVDSISEELPILSVRATEYTVGPAGPSAMPAYLPPSSAYTYCVELSADEAIAANADEVVFSEPVSVYLENFLGFATGSALPVGFYNRPTGVWIPEPNGVIIKIVNIIDGAATVDLDGDDIAETEEALMTKGFEHQELVQLASLYAPGQSLWRAQVRHFSPCDINLQLLANALLDLLKDLVNGNSPKCDKTDCTGGSIIGIQNQSLGEVIPISGTPFSLYYHSDQVRPTLQQRRLSIPITGNTVSPAIEDINVKINIAGQSVSYSFPTQPNLKMDYFWDGKDAYGRRVQGEQPYTVDVSYKHEIFYMMVKMSSDSSLFGDPVVDYMDLEWYYPVKGPSEWTTRTSRGTIGNYDRTAQKFGGFSLNAYHVYEPYSRRVRLGDGTTRSAQSVGQVVSVVSGTEGVGREHGATASDGTIYFSDNVTNQIYRRCVDGTITIFAGTGDEGYSGDGGFATEAQLNNPRGIAVASDGTVYVADTYNHAVRKITLDGKIVTVAGTGESGYNGDWIQAKNAQLSYPYDIALSKDGSLYIADAQNFRIRRVDVTGRITTVAGNSTCEEFPGGELQAVQFGICVPVAVDVAFNGDVYFSANNRIFKVTPDGYIRHFAGNGEYGFGGDGDSAIYAQFDNPADLAVGSDGTVFIADHYNNRVRYVNAEGIIGTLAGTGDLQGDGGYEAAGNNGPAAQATFAFPHGIFLDNDGTVYVCDEISVLLSSTTITGLEASNYIRKIAPAFQGSSLTNYLLPSEDGSEIYVFDATGRHLQTLDALLHTPLLTFSYNESGLVSSLTDKDSLVTTIERDASGNPTSIISPYGLRTILKVNSNNYLEEATNPAGETTKYTYTGEGAMTSKTDPKNNVHYFVYDSLGLLMYDYDPAGGFKKLERKEVTKGYEVSVTTAEGSKNTYRVQQLSAGGILKTNTDANGLVTTITEGEDGHEVIVSPDGTTTTVVYSPDPRFGMQAPLSTITTQTPSGLTSTVSRKREIFQLSGLQVTAMRELTSINDRIYSTIFRTLQGNMGEGDFTFSAANGAFVSIAGEPGTITAGSGDDITFSNIPIGFNFKFGGTYYSKVAICSNGWISFNASTANTNLGYEDPHDLASASNIYPLVAPLYDDLIVNGNIYYAASGAAPNRVFTVEWNNVGWNYSNGGNSISFQVIFYEETGNIQFVYTPGPNGIYDGGAAIGLADAGRYLSVSDLSIDATASKTSENDYIATTPPDGLTFSFTPSEPVAYTGARGMFQRVSPEGRGSFTYVNAQGRVIKDSIPGMLAVNYTYDSKGRVISVTQGERTSSFAYNAQGMVDSATDPLQRTAGFEYDSVGRVLLQTLPDGKTIAYRYDANGNLLGLTPPEKPEHAFDYTVTDLTNQYRPPFAGDSVRATGYAYDLDKRITTTHLPNGDSITIIYAPSGCNCGGTTSRIASVTFNRGTQTFTYDASGNLLQTISAAGDTLLYAYDGSLHTSVTALGNVNGNVSVAYDNNLRVTSQSVNDGSTVNFGYSDDGLLTVIDDYEAGTSMEITYDPSNGLPTGTTLGNVTTSQTYSSYGELASYQAKYGASTLFSTGYTRDSLGRISTLSETIEGESKTYAYSYDQVGRLIGVKKNGVLVSSYSYDANDNRLSHWTPTTTDSGSYDTQDRLLNYSNTSYFYTRNGELQVKVVGSDTTKYAYDNFGNLIAMQLPNGDMVEYVVDGQNRRIAKKLNGNFVRRWIYSGQLSPVVELDSVGNVSARFAEAFMIKAGVTYRFVTDHLGSIRLVVNTSTGAIVQRLDYDEFGNVTFDSNPDFQPFAYAGGLYDSQTKLVRFGFRDYDAITGRWTTKDPIKFSGLQTNLYSYINSNPLNATDRIGLCWLYSQTSGQLWWIDNPTGDMFYAGSGYSGSPEGLNNSSMQNVSNVGPIPQGTWEIGQAYPHPRLGDVTMNLTPTGNTVTFGRDLFRIHGDNSEGNQSASEGCIVLRPEIRNMINQSNDHCLRVIQ